MAIRDLLCAFERENSLPVDLNKIADWVKRCGAQDEIDFIGVQLDTEVIRGFLHRFRYQTAVYGGPVNVANIYYATNQSEDWINIVCAKELVHIMDGHHVHTKEAFDNLVRRLALPKELKIILEDPAYALMDKFGDSFAAAILLPMAARNVLIDAYNANDVTAADIARAAVMPVHYVRMVMAPEWVAAYERMREAF